MTLRRTLVAASPLALLALLYTPVLTAQPTKTLKAGVVKIEVKKNDGLVDTGAGSVIGVKGKTVFILTANHVVSDAESINVYFEGTRWEPRTATLFRFDDQLDIAAIYLNHPDPPTELPKFQTRTSELMKGESVTAIGHPQGLEWEDLIESVVRTTDTIETRMFLVSNARIDRGSSGGPVFDSDGALMGVVIELEPKHAKVVMIEHAIKKLQGWSTPMSNLAAEGMVGSATASVPSSGQMTPPSAPATLPGGIELTPVQARQLGCQKGSADECYALAEMYYYEDEVEEDYVKAANFYGMACDKKHAQACYALGDMYYSGEGVAENDVKATQYYHLGCQNGYGESCYYAGDMYYSGEGVAENERKAAEYYKLACDKDYGDGCYDLGSMYEYGEGVSESLPKAAGFYELACQRGSAAGCNDLGSLYYSGEGVMVDLAKAVQLYETACRRNYGSGCFALGNMYYDGDGVARDFASAKRFYDLACKAQHEEACTKLATMN